MRCRPWRRYASASSVCCSPASILMRRSMSRSRISTRYVPGPQLAAERHAAWRPRRRTSVEYSTRGSASKPPVQRGKAKDPKGAEAREERSRELFLLVAAALRAYAHSDESPCLAAPMFTGTCAAPQSRIEKVGRVCSKSLIENNFVVMTARGERNPEVVTLHSDRSQNARDEQAQDEQRRRFFARVRHADAYVVSSQKSWSGSAPPRLAPAHTASCCSSSIM